MNIKEIPLAVYDQLCRDFCEQQEEIIIYLDGKPWKTKREKKRFFFAYREDGDSAAWKQNSFAIWNAGPNDITAGTRLSSSDEVIILLKITAGSFPTGVWSYGQGQAIQERIKVQGLPYSEFFLGSTIVEIMCQAISEANLMAMSPECEREDFHEKEKELGKYDQPSL